MSASGEAEAARDSADLAGSETATSGGAQAKRAETSNEGKDASAKTEENLSNHDAEPGLVQDGYGLEIQGYDHRTLQDDEAIVFLPRETKYRIRLSNANHYPSMVSVQLDDVHIGTFLLYPFTKCDVERPTDRALGFYYMLCAGKRAAAAASTTTAAAAPTNSNSKFNKKAMLKEKTAVVANFKPEMGGKIIQIDVTAHHMNKTQRLEMLNETTVRELFDEVKRDFGDWILTPFCALIHWTTAEYDSPVEDILHSDQNTALRAFRSQNDPLRKMSLVSVEHVQLDVEGATTRNLNTHDGVPTFGRILSALEDIIKEDQILYFLSATGRYVCSTDWVQEHTCILQVLHRDEILDHHSSIHLKCSPSAPHYMRHVIVRQMNGGTHDLKVVPETTIRECRYQLEALGGPWGEAPRWLFGGTLLESGRSIGYYGIGHHNIVDVVPRLQEKVDFQKLEMRDPISVDGDKPVNTGEMIIREEAACSKAAKATAFSKSKRRTRGTILRGKVNQQYIEVDPIVTDSRFPTTLSINILPKEHEEAILEASLAEHEKEKSRGCVVC